MNNNSNSNSNHNTKHSDNPLLDLDDKQLPRFADIQPTHVSPAITSLIAQCRDLLARLGDSEHTPATWEDFARPLSDGLEKLSRAWGVVSHLHGVCDVPAWRDAYNSELAAVSGFFADLGQNRALYEQYKKLAASPAFHELSAARQKIVHDELTAFRLGGAELAAADQAKFKALAEESSQLAAKFSENLLDATNAFTHVVVDENELTGLPDDVKTAAREAAQQAQTEQAENKSSRQSWRFDLHMPSYLPLMQYAENRALRQTMYRAYATRAAEFAVGGDTVSAKAQWNNSPLMQRILQCRREEAQLLGYANYAEVSLVEKMANSPDEVLTFLRDLAHRAKPFAERDVRELREFAASELALPELEAWDVAYASEKLREQRYAFSEQEVRQYFREDRVLEGLFSTIKTLYGVDIYADTAPGGVWHEDVRFFRLQNQSGEAIAYFYLDLYARPQKRGGAWMDDARSRKRLISGELQRPVAYLTCNFPRPVGGKPATFTHDDVCTLFHETGHGLHHMLTQVDDLPVSGINGVEWDAVELPSQFMENFCWQWEVVQGMSAHVDTGDRLPKALFDKMLAARNFQSGMACLRQVEFALFDMLLHSAFDPDHDDIYQLLAAVRQETAVLMPPSWQRFPNSFSHIFAGGYAAGYYSYKWAEVLSADAYAAFEEQGNPLNHEVGNRFWREILSVGGSRPALSSFIAFRGRAPTIDALLRHSGMVEAAAA